MFIEIIFVLFAHRFHKIFSSNIIYVSLILKLYL